MVVGVRLATFNPEFFFSILCSGPPIFGYSLIPILCLGVMCFELNCAVARCYQRMAAQDHTKS